MEALTEDRSLMVHHPLLLQDSRLTTQYQWEGGTDLHVISIQAVIYRKHDKDLGNPQIHQKTEIMMVE